MLVPVGHLEQSTLAHPVRIRVPRDGALGVSVVMLHAAVHTAYGCLGRRIIPSAPLVVFALLGKDKTNHHHHYYGKIAAPAAAGPAQQRFRHPATTQSLDWTTGRGGGVGPGRKVWEAEMSHRVRHFFLEGLQVDT